MGIEIQLLRGRPVFVKGGLQNAGEQVCADILNPSQPIGVGAIVPDVLVVLAKAVVVIIAAPEIASLGLQLLRIDAGAEVARSVFDTERVGLCLAKLGAVRQHNDLGRYGYDLLLDGEDSISLKGLIESPFHQLAVHEAGLLRQRVCDPGAERALTGHCGECVEVFLNVGHCRPDVFLVLVDKSRKSGGNILPLHGIH